MSRPRWGDGPDRGSATIWTLAAGALLVAVASAAILAGSATIARHEAQSAADFGALAGAARAELDPASACTVAGSVVRANGAVMTSCRVEAYDVVVAAAVAVAGAPVAIGPAAAVARAGPIQAGPIQAGPMHGGPMHGDPMQTGSPGRADTGRSDDHCETRR